MTVYWTLPTGGDSRYLVAGGAGVGGVSAAGDREATLAYLTQITVAVEQAGFTGVALPAGGWDDDGLVTAALLAGATRNVRFLVSAQSVSPSAVRTFQRHTGGRLLLDVPDDPRTDGLVFVPAAPPPAVAAHVAQIRAAATHPVRVAVRLHVITRDTSGQAWAHARRLLAALSSGGPLTAHGGDAAQLEVHPNLWAGVGLVPGAADLALVGNHAQVADRVAEYVAAGVDALVLSGRPALEEAYWFADGVLPRLTPARLALTR
jgi:alkanesulfonate monooxygenase SsuD/methylene tetrahydromethanopterin reductase-like flavin-dependent oxidoreductase (luciferase family)